MSKATTSKVSKKDASAEIVAAIVGAVTAMGYSASQIASIRPIISRNWRLEGRLRSRL